HRCSQMRSESRNRLFHPCLICVHLWLKDSVASRIALQIDIVVGLKPMRLEPTNIQHIGNELAIQWNDGAESYRDLQFLRRACPCAACGGEPDVLGNIMRPNVSYSENSFELAGFDVVGGYAIQPRWRDGHGTGIYSFQYLRRISQPVTSR